MDNIKSMNRKLLVSVFNPQEAREAVLGGGRIIDSEDPRSALGNIKPDHIMAISDAVLNYKRDLEVQLSTNIGEDQLLFDRSERGEAIEKSLYEIAGKAAQAAIGVSCSMGTRVHPCNIVKVGVDGMDVDMVREVLKEVVFTLDRTEQFSHCQVMSVLFAQDIEEWNNRKQEEEFRKVLVGLREFHLVSPGSNDPDVFSLPDYAVKNLRDEDGNILFNNKKSVTLNKLIEDKVLPDNATHMNVKLNELFPHKRYFPDVDTMGRTNKQVIKAMVDVTAEAGADSIMIDSRIQSKVARICVVDTASKGMVDINRFDHDDHKRLPRKGILSLDELKFFVEHCHYKGIEANVAGSVQSYQAQQLWVKIPELDQISTRGASSAVPIDPTGAEGEDTRQHRVIKRSLVRGLAPPEHGGVLNLPADMENDKKAMVEIAKLRKMLEKERRSQGLPALECYFVDRWGEVKQV